MNAFVIALSLLSNPAFADDDKSDTEETDEKKTSSPKTPKEAKKEKEEKSTDQKTSSDAGLKTISPDAVKSPKQTNTVTTPGPTKTNTTPQSDSRKQTTPVGTSTQETSTRRRTKRTSTSGSSSSTPTAAAGIATAAVGMAALALVPTKTSKVKCPFDKARVGMRGGAQLSQAEEAPFGGGLAIGYRWCSPFAVEASYVHFGDLELNANAPFQTSLQMFLFSSLVSPYLTAGASFTMDKDVLLYGPHGGIGAQILIKTKKSVAAVNLEGRYAQYMNEETISQQSQIQGILGVDFYF